MPWTKLGIMLSSCQLCISSSSQNLWRVEPLNWQRPGSLIIVSQGGFLQRSLPWKAWGHCHVSGHSGLTQVWMRDRMYAMQSPSQPAHNASYKGSSWTPHQNPFGVLVKNTKSWTCDLLNDSIWGCYPGIYTVWAILDIFIWEHERK